MKRTISVIILCLLICQAHSTSVTNLSGFYQSGQVFFTWDNVAPDTTFYKLYRSSSPIVNGTQLPACEYLGITYQFSAINHNLTSVDGFDVYWIIEPGGNPLQPGTGLFVSTTVLDGSFYYAVTTSVGGIEDTSIIPGENSLTQSIIETISDPQPIYQQTRMINGLPAEVYGDFFFTSRNTFNGPLRLKKAGWLGYSFAIFKNEGTPGPHPLRIRFHPGGNDFLNKITNAKINEINLGLEDYFPDDELNSSWIGTHEEYDPYFEENDTLPPSSGVNYFYTQERILHTIHWMFQNFDIDTNRIYMEGTSFGAYGAFFFAMLNPEKVAAIDITGGMFDFGYETDWNPDCTMNTGEKNRIDGENKYGTVADNFPEAVSGTGIYTLLNGGSIIHENILKDFPVIYSVNGRNDEALGWTEKTIWYDSVNNNRIGGYYFFDNRDHAGQGRSWNSNNFDLFRYARNVSYPAFSNCSANHDAGNGNGPDGDSVGTINGFLDWQEDITDELYIWKVDIYMRTLQKYNNQFVAPPDSCFTDITLRRRQKFSPPPGSNLIWKVKHLNQEIQSGTLPYSGGLITVPEIKVFKDTVEFEIVYVLGAIDTFYLDADHDGFGDASSYIIAVTAPADYVPDSSDCDDANEFIFPGATEICNGLDDNCNGLNDDGLIFSNYYLDFDEDTYGDADSMIAACDGAPAGYVMVSTDCNDLNPDVYPGANEIQNGMDDNCDGYVDEFGAGINTLDDDYLLKVYPNPSHDMVMLLFDNDLPQTVQVINILGETVITHSFSVETIETIQLDLRSLDAGMYLVRVQTDKGMVVRQLAKE